MPVSCRGGASFILPLTNAMILSSVFSPWIDSAKPLKTRFDLLVYCSVLSAHSSKTSILFSSSPILLSFMVSCVIMSSIRALIWSSFSRVERLSRLAYNDAPISTQDNHAKEQFIDVITDDDLRIRILQTRPANLQDALRTALELESYTLAVRRSPTVRAVNVSEQEAKRQELTTELVRDMFTELSANMAKMLGRTVDGRRPTPRTTNAEPERMPGACWNCGEGGISFAIAPTCKTHTIGNNRGQKTKAGRQILAGKGHSVVEKASRIDGAPVAGIRDNCHRETRNSRLPAAEIGCKKWASLPR